MTKNKQLREYKKLLVFLYEQFDGSQTKILQELLDRKLKADAETVNQYLKDNGIKVSDYIAFFETRFKIGDDIDPTHPILCIKKEKKHV